MQISWTGFRAISFHMIFEYQRLAKVESYKLKKKNNLRKHNLQGSTMGGGKGLQSYPATILEPFSESPGGGF